MKLLNETPKRVFAGFTVLLVSVSLLAVPSIATATPQGVEASYTAVPAQSYEQGYSAGFQQGRNNATDHIVGGQSLENLTNVPSETGLNGNRCVGVSSLLIEACSDEYVEGYSAGYSAGFDEQTVFLAENTVSDEPRTIDEGIALGDALYGLAVEHLTSESISSISVDALSESVCVGVNEVNVSTGNIVPVCSEGFREGVVAGWASAVETDTSSAVSPYGPTLTQLGFALGFSTVEDITDFDAYIETVFPSVSGEIDNHSVFVPLSADAPVFNPNGTDSHRSLDIEAIYAGDTSSLLSAGLFFGSAVSFDGETQVSSWFSDDFAVSAFTPTEESRANFTAFTDYLFTELQVPPTGGVLNEAERAEFSPAFVEGYNHKRDIPVVEQDESGAFCATVFSEVNVGHYYNECVDTLITDTASSTHHNPVEVSPVDNQFFGWGLSASVISNRSLSPSYFTGFGQNITAYVGESVENTHAYLYELQGASVAPTHIEATMLPAEGWATQEYAGDFTLLKNHSNGVINNNDGFIGTVASDDAANLLTFRSDGYTRTVVSPAATPLLVDTRTEGLEAFSGASQQGAYIYMTAPNVEYTHPSLPTVYGYEYKVDLFSPTGEVFTVFTTEYVAADNLVVDCEATAEVGCVDVNGFTSEVRSYSYATSGTPTPPTPSAPFSVYVNECPVVDYRVSGEDLIADVQFSVFFNSSLDESNYDLIKPAYYDGFVLTNKASGDEIEGAPSAFSMSERDPFATYETSTLVVEGEVMTVLTSTADTEIVFTGGAEWFASAEKDLFFQGTVWTTNGLVSSDGDFVAEFSSDNSFDCSIVSNFEPVVPTPPTPEQPAPTAPAALETTGSETSRTLLTLISLFSLMLGGVLIASGVVLKIRATE